MTYEEAILIIENETPHCGEKLTFSEGEICEAASIAKEAIGKQIPQKPAEQWGNHVCPNCRTGTHCRVVMGWEMHCPDCGQAIDWSDDEMNDYKELIELLDGACIVKVAMEDMQKADLFARAADAIEQLVKERDELRNELCLRCGEYVEAHNGACNGCKWRATE